MATTRSAPDSCHLSLFLIAAFAKSLNHKIRTPLTVVSTDLAYLKGIHSDQEIDKTEKKCREIAEILDWLKNHPSGVSIRPVKLRDFLDSSDFFSEQELLSDRTMMVDPEALRSVVLKVRSLIASDGKFRVTEQSGGLELHLGRTDGDGYELVTQMCLAENASDDEAIEAVWIDAVLLAHGATWLCGRGWFVLTLPPTGTESTKSE